MNKGISYKIGFVIVMLLIIFSIVSNVSLFFLKDVDKTTKYGAIPTLFCCGAALYYAICGFKKDTARAYVLYMFFLGIALLRNCIRAYEVLNLKNQYETSSFGKYFGIGILGASAIFVFILAISKDLGKIKSLILISLSLLAQLFIFVRSIFEYSSNGIISSIQLNADVVRAAGLLIVNLVGLALVLEKYADKKRRGSK